MLQAQAVPVWRYTTCPCWTYQVYSNGCGSPGDPEDVYCWKEKTFKWYKHPDLNRFSQEAFAEGKDEFYVKQKCIDDPYALGFERVLENEIKDYHSHINVSKDLYEQWIGGTFTKVVLEARNKNQLLAAVIMAEKLGMQEGEDFFLIKDNCYTELEPEEVDENGVGRTLTCIGFAPMNAEKIDQIGKKYHIYT
jgi:peptidyl-tRNA hydrolase